jgi:uncharacterized membrane protein YukC
VSICVSRSFITLFGASRMNINKQKLKKYAWSVFKYTAFAIGVIALLAFMQFVVLVLMMAGYL